MAVTNSVVHHHRLRYFLKILIRLALGAWVTVGGGLFIYFGWQYAHQLLGLGESTLPVYSPPPREKAELWAAPPERGTKIGDLEIPSLHLRVPVIQGTDPDQLDRGAGHWISSALPGQPGDVYIAGHRDTVFAPLRGVKIGDSVIFHTPYGDFVYKVISTAIIPETDVSVLHSSSPGQTMTLQTCYPFFFFGFAPDRYLIRAELIRGPLVPFSTKTRP